MFCTKSVIFIDIFHRVYVIGAIIRENLARNAQGVFSATSGMVWKVSISQERMNWIYGVVSGA
jgi:hypothetical protein